jgi:hypothetical protein
MDLFRLQGSRGRHLFCFQYVVFPTYLEFWTMNKVHKPSNSECYTPQSEPFRFHKITFAFGFRESNVMTNTAMHKLIT